MTTKISPQKLSRMLQLYFQGYNQVQIAQKLGIDQSTVSLYVSKFGMQSQGKGLMAASKEAGIVEMISALHSLAAELHASKLTAEEAKLGLKARLKLEQYGVEEQHYPDLIEAAAKMKEKGFMKAALKLASLEKKTGIGYTELTAKYEAVVSQISQKSKELGSLEAALTKQQSELKVIVGKRKEREKNYGLYIQQTDMTMKRLELVETLSLLLKKLGVKDGEMEAYIQRQKELDAGGIDIKLFGKIANKAADVTSGDGGKQLLDMLTEYGNLPAAIDKLSDVKADLEKQSAGLSERVKEKNQLVAEIAKLAMDKNDLAYVVKDLEGKAKVKDQLDYQIKSLENDKQGTQKDITSLQSQKLAMEEEVVSTKWKLTELQPLKTQHEELTAKVAELDKTLMEKGKEREVFEAFLGFIQNSTPADIGRFIKSLPEMVTLAKSGQHSTEAIKQVIIDKLTMGQANVYTCGLCKTEFFVNHAPAFSKKFSCPNCNNSTFVEAKG